MPDETDDTKILNSFSHGELEDTSHCAICFCMLDSYQDWSGTFGCSRSTFLEQHSFDYILYAIIKTSCDH